MYRAEKNEADIRYIINHLRKEDRQEVRALHNCKNWKERLLKTLLKQENVIIGKSRKGNIPILVTGYLTNPTDESIGIVWLLCTDEIKKHIRVFFREFSKELGIIDEKYSITCNMIYNKNRSAKRWLKRFGYRFDRMNLKGINIPAGFEFFYRVREVKGLGE